MRDQERLFVEEYLIDLNATQAALRAGYRPATAAKAAEWIKAENPSKPALRAELDRRMAERSRRTGVNADRVVLELARVAFADPMNVIDPKTGGLLQNIAAEDRALIAGFRKKSGDDWVEQEVRLADRLRALELLGKHLGMFSEGVKVEGAVPTIVLSVPDEPQQTEARGQIGFSSDGDGGAD